MTILNDRLQRKDLLREGAHVGGEWVPAGGQGFPVTNPATGETIAVLPRMTASDTEAAVAAADRALPAWRSLTALERSNVMRRWADLIRANADDIALILTAEQGKPVPEAKGEVVYSSQFLDWFAEEGRRLYGDVIPSHSSDVRIVVIKQPVGVTAGSRRGTCRPR